MHRRAFIKGAAALAALMAFSREAALAEPAARPRVRYQIEVPAYPGRAVPWRVGDVFRVHGTGRDAGDYMVTEVTGGTGGTVTLSPQP